MTIDRERDQLVDERRIRQTARGLVVAAAWHVAPAVGVLRLRRASTHKVWADAISLIPDVDYGRENDTVKHKCATNVKKFSVSDR